MIENKLSWKIGGEAGYGIMRTAYIFAKVCSRGGLNVFYYPEYPSLIRGGHNNVQVRVEEGPVSSQIRLVDLLVALNQETVDLHKDELTDGGGIIYDPDDVHVEGGGETRLYPVPFGSMCRDLKLDLLMRNTISLGVTLGLLDYDVGLLYETIEDNYGGKGKKVLNENRLSARAGYELAREKFGGFSHRLRKTGKPRLVFSGNGAISTGAIKAGCKFYSAYPMTPATTILHFMAEQERNFKIVVKQSEDEIAAINMAIGANFAGVRAMAATSGGGFALMAEALGLAAMTETPLVLVVSQRPGPSTGLPTWTSQGDLNFVLNASQGEFPRIVLAPGDVLEAYELTFRAFNLSETYQTPVIILSDKYLSESYTTVDSLNTDLKVDRGELLGEIKGDYRRYEFTDSGISPRVLPGTPGAFYKCTGNEHDERGMLSEDPGIRRKQMEKRFRKLGSFGPEVPKVYGSTDAEVTFIGWGSVKGPVLQAIEFLGREGIPVNLIHYTFLAPFPKDAGKIRKAENPVIIENNFTSQLGGLLRKETGIEVERKLLKYDGRPFYPEEICDYVRGIMR